MRGRWSKLCSVNYKGAGMRVNHSGHYSTSIFKVPFNCFVTLCLWGVWVSLDWLINVIVWIMFPFFLVHCGHIIATKAPSAGDARFLLPTEFFPIYSVGVGAWVGSVKAIQPYVLRLILVERTRSQVWCVEALIFTHSSPPGSVDDGSLSLIITPITTQR